MKNTKIVKYLIKHKRVMKYITNISFGIGAVLGAYAMYTTFVTYANLPPGVCPLDNGRPVFIVAVVFLSISIITSFFAEKKKKKADTQDTEK